jgi:DNA-binding NtrC family response regulator
MHPVPIAATPRHSQGQLVRSRAINLSLTKPAHRGSTAWGSFVLDPLPAKEAGVDRGVLMTTVHVAAPQDAQFLAPNQIVPLLIGATVDEVERELVLQTLARCDGNRTRASRVLGLSVRTLRNKIRIYAASGIEVPAYHD